VFRKRSDEPSCGYWAVNPQLTGGPTPAVNDHGGFGRWAFLEVSDAYDDVVTLIRAAMTQTPAQAAP